ncbi:desmoplakin protein [Gynaephora ruoergensis nucleopolyhedrovirus]|nr:desmoplakin protein [Gynaephora ruoergensis nucleopolyhedrovirus]
MSTTPFSLLALRIAFKFFHFIRLMSVERRAIRGVLLLKLLFVSNSTAVMSNYRNAQAKYMNTDVNANTVKNLLNTINTITKQCKAQSVTDNTLDRIRSIVYLYRPHLKLRYDLQITELVIEALAPAASSSSIPNQITHNFNYKYDYNTNMAAAAPGFLPPAAPVIPSHVLLDPFGAPQPPLSDGDNPLTYRQPPPVQQNYYINPAENGGTKRPRRRSPSPDVKSSRVALARNDVAMIEQDLFNVNRTTPPTIGSFKKLIKTLTTVARSYISTEIFFNGLERVYAFDASVNVAKTENDVDSLIRCINKETGLNLNANSPQLCAAISSVINGYYQFTLNIIGNDERFSFDDIKTADEIKIHTGTLIGRLQDFTHRIKDESEARDRAERELESNARDLKRVTESLRVTNERCRSIEENYSDAAAKILKYENVLVKMENIARPTVFLSTPGNLSLTSIVDYFEKIHAEWKDLNDRVAAQANQLELAKSQMSDAIYVKQQRAAIDENENKNLADLHSRINAYRETITRARNALLSRNIVFNPSESAVDVLIGEYEKTVATINDLRTQLANFESGQISVKSFNDRIAILNGRINDLQNELIEQQKLNATFREKLDNAERDEKNRQTVQDANLDLKTQINKLVSDKSDMQNEIDVVRQKLIEANENLSKFEKRNAALSGQLEDMRNESPTISLKRKQAKRVTAAEANLTDNDELLNQFENKDAYFEQLQKDIAEVKNDLNRVISSSNMTGADFLALTSKINKTKIEECDRLKQKMANLTEITNVAIANKADEITRDIDDNLKIVNSRMDNFNKLYLDIKNNVNQYRLNYESLARSAMYKNLTSSNEVSSTTSAVPTDAAMAAANRLFTSQAIGEADSTQ